jgi:hypothetical protein
MQKAIQFETIIESGLIRIPEQFIREISPAVKVTLTPLGNPRIKIGRKSKSSELTANDFSALKINTEGWRFHREDALG